MLAADGDLIEAENLLTDDPPVMCSYRELPDPFGFFLSLANIKTVPTSARELVRYSRDGPSEPTLHRARETIRIGARWNISSRVMALDPGRHLNKTRKARCTALEKTIRAKALDLPEAPISKFRSVSETCAGMPERRHGLAQSIGFARG